MSLDLKSLLPRIYDNIVETDSLTAVEGNLLDQHLSELSTVLDNQFILTANEAAITEYESFFKITAAPAESLDFRRQRLLNRSSMCPPFTLRFLHQRLDEIIGVGRWETLVDPANYTLYIYSSASDQNWFEEIQVTVHKIKPANIVFMNSPRVLDTIDINEAVKLFQRIYNYSLGVGWNLGEKPFVSLSNGEVIKMSTTPSIQGTLLNSLATFTAADIASVRVNGTYSITTFVTKSATNNVATIEYTIPVSSGLATITQLELLDSNGNQLTKSSVYVPLLQDVQMQHKITTSEG